MPTGIEVRGCEEVGKRVVIRAHNKRLVDEIFLKVVRNGPLKCEELGLGPSGSFRLLSLGQRSTPIGNGMQLSILPFLEQDCSQTRSDDASVSRMKGFE